MKVNALILVLYSTLYPTQSTRHESTYQSEYRLIPTKLHGHRRKISVSDLTCQSPDQSSVGIKSFEISLVTVEPRTRTGFFCVGISTNITCRSGWGSYDFLTTQTKAQVSKEKCSALIHKFQHGHLSGFRETTPDCALGYTSLREENYVLIYRAILPFDPISEGVVSPGFSVGVCRSSYCSSEDDKVHWFLGDDEEPGCVGLIKSMGEIKVSVAGFQNSELIGTKATGEIPLSHICQTKNYCGKLAFISNSYSGFLLDSLSGEVGQIIEQTVKRCEHNYGPHEHSNELSGMWMSYAELSQREFIKCLEVVKEGQMTGYISARYLTLFQPYTEGIYPGYRYEQDTLWEYDLYYMTGRLISTTITIRRETSYQWSLLGVNDEEFPLSKSLCYYDLEYENAAGGSLCQWFNGIILQGEEIIYPELLNYFSYDRDYPLMTLHSSNLTGDPLVEPNKSPFHEWWVNRALLEKLLITILPIVILCLAIYFYIRCKSPVESSTRDQSGPFIEEMETIRPVTGLMLSPHSVIQSVNDQGRNELTQIESRSSPMIEWFN